VSLDQTFSIRTRIARPADVVFGWHERPGALQRLCPPWETVEASTSPEGIRDGAIVTVRNKFGPWWLKWTVEHRDYVQGSHFRDVQLSGPFARWEHLHRFVPDGPDACWLIDEITYRLPVGGIGKTIGSGFVRRELSRLFKWRHATTKTDLEAELLASAVGARHIVIAGASGLIGRTLIPFLQTQGHHVTRLVRRSPAGNDELYWNPGAGELEARALDGVDTIINLSGENIAGGRWTAERRDAIFRSRVDATKTLVGAVQRMSRKPESFLSASAVGFYGDRGEEMLTERSTIGQGFLPEVCLAWETHAQGARKMGVRTALMRFGVILSPAGGALAKLLPVFRAGVGGAVGGGRQWMSWVGIDDVLGAIHHAMLNRDAEGPINVVAPEPATNREFTRVLASVLHRPAIVPVPRFALETLFGEMADATLLASERAVPERLIKLGYTFRYPELDKALRHGLGR